MSNDFKLCYIRRRAVTWCSIKYDIVPFKQLIQEHYRQLAMKGGLDSAATAPSNIFNMTEVILYEMDN